MADAARVLEAAQHRRQLQVPRAAGALVALGGLQLDDDEAVAEVGHGVVEQPGAGGQLDGVDGGRQVVVAAGDATGEVGQLRAQLRQLTAGRGSEAEGC